MAATRIRRAKRAARHAARALGRRNIPQVLATVAAAVVLAVGGTGLMLAADHDGAMNRVSHGMMHELDGNQPDGNPSDGHPQDGPRSGDQAGGDRQPGGAGPAGQHFQPPWEH